MRQRHQKRCHRLTHYVGLLEELPFRLARRSTDPCQKRGWRKNRDAPKGVKYQQVVVAGYDHIGMAVYSKFEKFVVGSVTALADGLANYDNFSLRYYFRKPHDKAWRDKPCKVGFCQYPKQFYICGLGHEQLVFCDNQFYSNTRQ